MEVALTQKSIMKKERTDTRENRKLEKIRHSRKSTHFARLLIQYPENLPCMYREASNERKKKRRLSVTRGAVALFEIVRVG